MTKKRVIYTISVVLIVVFSTTFAILMTLERMDYRNYLQGEYSKNMYQLIDSVRNIKVDLGKSAIVGSREQSIVIFGDIFRYSDIANDKIHSLPISQEYIEGTSKFLSQVGDFAYSLAKVSSQGKELSDDDYKSMEELKNQADYLLVGLNTVQSDINEGKVKWGEVRKKATKALKNNEGKLVSDKFKEIQKQVVQYPALIYDGPFSDNILEIKPKVISQKKITEAEAIAIVKKTIGESKISNVLKKETEGKTKIPSYSFGVTVKGAEKGEEIAVEVSKNGGKIVYLLDNKDIGKTKINLKKAIDLGSRYLSDIGYKNMKSTYALKSENVAVISYAYNQDNVIIYPDQVKLKISLEDGSIVGIESEKYLTAHIENRQIQKPRITQEQARQRVGKNLNVTSVNLALIPTENNKEALCYEFIGGYKDDSFIVYINADTGFEQRILQIINTPNGALTM
ncbi:germination protein YpeB [Clostridium sp. MB40-C1]|uniref:germination protein YpeB n=1 Tax=Clostridium sp. MB40-C1 TaxID=3070996 RepID=UPI0027DF773A|nr:germination protein YpeB [Clostridium sp. MB40-C1]WMJ82459.1 germination protein YpeB [Clostridium sp. MB40-C1]